MLFGPLTGRARSDIRAHNRRGLRDAQIDDVRDISLQRRGYGSLVLARLEDHARGVGYSKLRLDTTVMQTAAQALYTREGYTEVGRGQLAGVEVVYFEKRLA